MRLTIDNPSFFEGFIDVISFRKLNFWDVEKTELFLSETELMEELWQEVGQEMRSSMSVVAKELNEYCSNV